MQNSAVCTAGDLPVVQPPVTPSPILIRSQSEAKSEAHTESTFDVTYTQPGKDSDNAPDPNVRTSRRGSITRTPTPPPVSAVAQKVPKKKRGTSYPGSEPKKESSQFTLSYVEVALLTYSVFYAAVSRVPFTLFAIYMIDELNFSYIIAALTLGLYCFGRLVGAHIAGYYLGSVTMIFGTASGAVAWAAILLFYNQWSFIVSCFLLGFTETVTGLDSMLKIESLILNRKPEQTQIIFRSQLICTCLGVFIAYMGGGMLYQSRGMGPVGVVCIAFSCINLVILGAMFPRRRIYRQAFIRMGDLLGEIEAGAPKGRKSRVSVAGKDVKVRSRVSTYNIDAVEVLDVDEGAQVSRRSLRDDDTETSTPLRMQTPLFLGTVVACFFFTTLGISTQFAISALYWKRVWSVSPDVVGTIMAIGECLGVCLLVIFGQPIVFNSSATKFFGKPANVLNACVGMGLLCWLITVNNRVACAVGSVGVHMCNVCVHSFQAELVGVCASGEEFAKWISLSYVVKRAANCVCVFGSIVFFDSFGPQTSYRVIGSGLIFYASVLCGMYSCMRVLPCQLKRTGK